MKLIANARRDSRSSPSNSRNPFHLGPQGPKAIGVPSRVIISLASRDTSWLIALRAPSKERCCRPSFGWRHQIKAMIRIGSSPLQDRRRQRAPGYGRHSSIGRIDIEMRIRLNGMPAPQCLQGLPRRLAQGEWNTQHAPTHRPAVPGDLPAPAGAQAQNG